MIIPSIDIMGGRAVQLSRGSRFEMDCGDPRELVERWSVYGQVAVVDLDAALGQGDNSALMLDLVKRAPCRVGGGLRDQADVTRFLDAGAQAVMLGTRAEPEFLSLFPRQRLIVALDGQDGRVSVDGWRRDTGLGVRERFLELAPYASGFLVTDVGREGLLGGLDLDSARGLTALAADSGWDGRLCFAGGLRSADEVAALDALGADVQAGMAIYSGVLDPADALIACLRSDRPDGLWPTVVCDQRGVALGLAWSDAESLRLAISERAGVYRSRTRGLWRKGRESGNPQELVRVDLDCDRDALRFTARQRGEGFCHQGTRSCWGSGGLAADPADSGLGRLWRTVDGRLADLASGSAPAASYTARLASDPALLAAKLREEADELALARTPDEAASEAADVFYFLATALAAKGSSLEAAERVLDARSLRLTRRPGNAKPGALAGAVRFTAAEGIH
ncbi:MAG: phosphoribosyl-ATP diphosphatase [Spirochaetia bacterium]|nr:phosphoribosyl-ATP diphosphatase [Spirochaetia bacterium]